MSVDEIPTGNTYDKYGTKNPVERAMVGNFMKRVEGMLPADGVSVILEVGAGEGHISRLLRARYPNAAVIALDLPDPALAAGWAEISGVFASAEDIPLADRSVDLVLGIEVLEHLPDPEAALREVARVARGPVLLSVPREPIWRALNMARGAYVRDLGNTPGHIQHWSSRGFQRLVARHLRVTATARPLPWTIVAASVR